MRYVYIGTSGFNIHKRMLEHESCARNHNTLNALGKHMNNCHQNENATFVTEILQGGIKFNLERLILEALEIEEAKRALRDQESYSCSNILKLEKAGPESESTKSCVCC